MLTRLPTFWLAMLMSVVTSAWAGESGLNVIVVVNQNSSNSVRLGNDYCEQRGVPPQNVFRMTGWTGGNIEWQEADFENYLLSPLLAMVSTRNLARQTEIVLLSMDIPYRVINGDSENSTTSALFYGFKENTVPPPGLPDTCSLPDDATNSYSFSELPFALAPPDTATTNAFLAMMLTDSSLPQAEATLARGIASDGSFPSETVYLEKTSDPARYVRFLSFDNAIQECRARSDNDIARINSDSTALTNALGLDTGLGSFLTPSGVFVPGAVADTLTSFAGEIFEISGQTPALAFLEAGASGTYGTIVEPCNYTYKFPDPMVYFYQNRGFCLAEAYYQSVATPYQGLMLGEPLSAPFARPGSATWNSPTGGSVLSGVTRLHLSFSAAETNLPLSQVDLFVDGNFVQTITNLPPGVGNVISVTVNGTSANYTVTNGDTLSSAALGLESALTAETNLTGVEAEAVGDRMVLRSQYVATLGGQISVQARTKIGSASALTTFATAALPNFLDSTAHGYHFLQTATNLLVGDWLQLTVTKTNGTQVTLALTNATAGEPITTFLQAFMNQINANSALQAADGVTASDILSITNRTEGFLVNAASPGWPAAQIQTLFTGSTNLDPIPNGTNALVDNVRDLQPRAQIYLSCGAESLAVQFSFDTTAFADGFHDLTAVAYEGTSVRTQTRTQQAVQFRNTSLSASFAEAGADAQGNLQFRVAANASNIARIELFSTGGSLALATNLAATDITASASTLGVGLHPFYAVVTDASGHQYKTQTVWKQVPALNLSLVGPPWTLSWATIPGRGYDILSATNLIGPYQTVGTVLATASQAQWPISVSSTGAVFYQVSVVN